MAKFVQLVTFRSSSTKFDERKDTRRINEFLVKLQNNGATVINVIPSIGGDIGNVAAVYVIIYEAPAPVAI